MGEQMTDHNGKNEKFVHLGSDKVDTLSDNVDAQKTTAYSRKIVQGVNHGVNLPF